ncbi:MAG TPA: hypothetical protein VE988_05590 [Gemmataceae bacterium]|nr:hypothetical protein [Gemmataceae bacterium]
MSSAREIRALLLVLALASVVAVASARPYAGSWNDGSRLATVECLVDRHTLVIDDSLFVAVPDDGTRNPYRGEALENGTLDKLYINGHFYSDKSPVPALLLAIIYQALQWLFGLNVRLHPEAFCWCMTVLSSGVAYVVAAVCMFRVGLVVGLPLVWRLVLTASFGLATIAVIYVQHVNNHILLLGVAAALMLQAAQLAESSAWRRVLLLGFLAGLGYTIDLGAGPPLLFCTGLLIVWTCPRRLAAGGLFVAGSVPWLALHHAVNYAVGGTFGPANAVPEYFNWDGCPFHGAALTGTWHHESFADFAVYAVALLFGKHGFVGHNPALFLLFPATIFLWGQRSKKPALLLAAAWCFGTWLIYAVTSRNYSGACCSIRWFVPLLAPAYFALAVILAQRPRWRADFLLLSAWGTVLMSLAWLQGPWDGHMAPGFWPILGAGLLSWMWLPWRRNRQKFLVIEREMQNCRLDETAQNQAA